MIKTNNIASRDNKRLKHARKVRDGKEIGEIFVEGSRLCAEALRSDIAIQECFVSEKFARSEKAVDLVGAILSRGIVVHEVTESLLDSIADTATPQGIVLICDRPASDRSAFEASFDRKSRNLLTVVYLDEPNNPANLGAILRVVEAAGAAGIIVSERSTDPFSAKSIRASMGSALRVSIWNEAKMDEAFSWARSHQLVITAADINGDRSYSQIDWNVPRLLVFGSEAHGLSNVSEQNIEDLIRIPMHGFAESLNLAVSAGVILFEANRQVRGPGKQTRPNS